jgi:glycosyltransferase involved in cell wall biosynthesis
VFSDSYKPYVSGVVNSIDIFNRELRSLGHEVFIFAPRYPNYQDTEPGIFRFRSVQAPTNRDFSVAIPFSLKFAPTIRKLNLDLIHVHSPFVLGQVGAVQARRFNLPLIFTYHTLYEQYIHYVPLGQNLTREFVVRLSRYFCNHCDLVITPTGKVKELLHDYGVQAPIEVIPTGIDLARFSQGDPTWLRKQLQMDPEVKLLLFVGRLTKEKNVDFLIRAFALTQKKFPETRLVIVAGGPEEERLKNLTMELGLTQQIVFMGQMTEQDLVNCYHGADFFVFPSVTETQGLVILEAMAAGLPVIAVDAFGVSDMIRSGIDGLLTRYTLEDFAAGICQLLENERQCEVIAAGSRAKAVELSSTQMALRLETAYQKVLGDRWNFAQKIPV